VAIRVDLNDAAIQDMLNGPDGPVAMLLAELSVKATAVALGLAPVQTPREWSWTKNFAKSTSYMPRSGGFTKASIKPHIGYTAAGHLFSGVNVAYAPTIWLESGRHGTRRVEPFMTTALFALSID
jgi:hypothetical protein